jgi:hypothetical protein
MVELVVRRRRPERAPRTRDVARHRSRRAATRRADRRAGIARRRSGTSSIRSCTRRISRSRPRTGTTPTASVETFGLRQISHRGNQLLLNDRPIFLRGNLECCIFPRTGYPPTDVAEWTRIYAIARSYGLNHFRFHSYCPPEAAFAAADRAGFLLHVELPFWVHDVGRVPARDAFMRAEGERIQDVYGNHPSFVMLALGNELQGDFAFMNALTNDLKRRDPRRLYTTHADYTRLKPEPSGDYYVCQKVAPKKFLRLHDSERPERRARHGLRLLVVHRGIRRAHHLSRGGQWVVNPAYDDFARYTGPLKPTNLAYFRDQLAARGMLDQAKRMTLATGRFAWTLYKEDIESALRTPHFGGIHLLQLQDFPGQGEALIGLLNALWDEKGIMTPAQFRSFCSETVTAAAVATLRLDERSDPSRRRPGPASRTRAAGLDARHLVAARFTRHDRRLRPLCATEHRLRSHHARYDRRAARAGDLGHAAHDLRGHTGHAGGESLERLGLSPRPGDPTLRRRRDRALVRCRRAIRAGRRAARASALRSDAETRRCDRLAMATGVLVPELVRGAAGNVEHPLRSRPSRPASFPTDFHSDYQWRELLESSKAFVLNDAPPAYRPVIQVIDDYHRNHKLAALFETRVGPGRLLACGMNLTDTSPNRPVARQMLRSLVDYVQSDRFAPVTELDAGLWRRLLA